MKQQIEQRKWTAMEHLSTGSKGRHHEFCQSFGINSIPEIVLVDKAGVIVYAGHPGGYKL
jgi:thioredoxin-related protein